MQALNPIGGIPLQVMNTFLKRYPLICAVQVGRPVIILKTFGFMEHNIMHIDNLGERNAEQGFALAIVEKFDFLYIPSRC